MLYLFLSKQAEIQGLEEILAKTVRKPQAEPGTEGSHLLSIDWITIEIYVLGRSSNNPSRRSRIQHRGKYALQILCTLITLMIVLSINCKKKKYAATLLLFFYCRGTTLCELQEVIWAITPCGSRTLCVQ